MLYVHIIQKLQCLYRSFRSQPLALSSTAVMFFVATFNLQLRGIKLKNNFFFIPIFFRPTFQSLLLIEFNLFFCGPENPIPVFRLWNLISVVPTIFFS